MADVVILGCGYTGGRVAAVLERQGYTVQGYRRREGFDCRNHAQLRAIRDGTTPETRVLLSVPTLRTDAGYWFDPTRDLIAAVRGARRLVYLSTTGVYGATKRVDEHTPVSPRGPRELLRVEAERAVLAEPRSMVLRPAAIYGPFRGVHTALREGRFALPSDCQAFTSRIHVDDLAALTAAALLSDAGGAWPVADEEPCTALEIATFCAELLSLPLPPVVATERLPETRRTDRQVDGSAVRRVLDVTLRYRSYREGIPASIAEEQSVAETG